MLTTWVLMISTKHGDSFWVFSSEEKASAYLDSWVRANWKEDGPDEPMPDDPAEAVERYFDHNGYDESYQMDQATIDPEPIAVKESTGC